MKAPPTILRRVAFKDVSPSARAPLKRLIHPSAWGSAVSAFQLRTQSVVEYLASTFLKTW
jgi:hypothetical protein